MLERVTWSDEFRFRRNDVMTEPELRALMTECGFSIANLSYRLDADDKAFEYRMVLRTTDGENHRRLAERLTGLDRVLEFRISPTGD